MAKRIFVAINLPENTKKKLAGYKKKWPDLPAMWTKEVNLHITLFFLGYIREENLLDICNKVKEAVKKHGSFDIFLNKISYGPPEKMPPRMVWAIGEKSIELAKLQSDLEKSLFSGINQNMEKYLPQVKKEVKAFSPHITLARIKQGQFNRMEVEEIPEVNEDISFRFGVNSIDIMESELKKSGPDYTILESVELKEI